MISQKSQSNALKILQRTSVVIFWPFVNFDIDEVLISDSFINSCLFNHLSISNFHSLLYETYYSSCCLFHARPKNSFLLGG